MCRDVGGTIEVCYHMKALQVHANAAFLGPIDSTPTVSLGLFRHAGGFGPRLPGNALHRHRTHYDIIN